MGDTKIEWANVVWNPTRGCSKVSEGCRNCFAMKQAHRFSGPGKPYEGLTKLVKGKGPQWTGEVRCVPEMLEKPLRWRKPRRIFVNSMSDLFHPEVPFGFVDSVFAVMALCPQHSFQLLTKRPERMREYFSDPDRGPLICDEVEETKEWKKRTALPVGDLKLPLRNVWLGTSVEDQATADERIPHLLQTPAAVRWLSLEPLLAPVDVTGGPWWDWRYSYAYWKVAFPNAGPPIGWIVVGSESGPRRRDCDLEWVRSIRDQCQKAGVPFFLKQLHVNGKKVGLPELDGRTWDEYPEPTP